MLAFFDLQARRYQDIPVTVQSEVLSLIGDITLNEQGEPHPIFTRCWACPTDRHVAGISSKAM